MLYLLSGRETAVLYLSSGRKMAVLYLLSARKTAALYLSSGRKTAACDDQVVAVVASTVVLASTPSRPQRGVK